MSFDERLVKRASRGDQRALEAIYRRYHQDLYRFCLAMVGNSQDAQDALQNTMVKVLRALPGETREIQLKPWLYRIARNESVETLRKRHDDAELEPHHAVAAGLTETAETRERLRTLLDDLGQLPERQRAVLVMRELSGLDFDQIGASFETSPAVARQTLYEARLSLRQLEAGRAMRCADVMREISNADGRVTRRREIRAHLRGCADCRAFRDGIGARHEDLAALAPLPLAASAALLQAVLGKTAATGAAVGGGSVAGGVGVGAGQAIATSTIVKSAATIAVSAALGVSAADRGGVIDVPLPGEGGSSASERPASSSPVPGAVESAKSTRTVPAKAEKATGNRPGDDTRGDGEDVRRSEAGGRSQDGVEATGDDRSRSQTGQNPPGRGEGRSASQQGGRPDGLPPASGQGQQTAAAHKPAHAASPPDKGESTGSPPSEPGAGAGGGRSAVKPEPPPTAKASPGPTPQAPPETPSGAGGDPDEQAPGVTPPGHRR